MITKFNNILIIVLIIILLLYSKHNLISSEQVSEQISSVSQQVINSKNILSDSQESNYFGQELFLSTAKDLSQLTIGNQFSHTQYRLGPGDKLGIYLSGKIQQDFAVFVNVEGKIYIPTVGVLKISGMSFKELQAFLKQKFTKFYDNFNIDVMLIQPKIVQVAVVGEVNNPGRYKLSALNTVIDAAVLAGGPTLSGSLRNIHLYRNGVLLCTVDLYEFLTKPQKVNDIFLATGDRIYFPLRKAKVAVSGQVNRIKTFELKPEADEKLSDIINLAGGFTDLANTAKIEVSRLMENGYREVIYIDYNKIIEDNNHKSNIKLKNDDNIHVFSIIDQTYKQYVHIHGEVKRPGDYILEENLTLSDLILKAGYFNRNAYLLEAEIAKIDPLTPTQYIKIDLLKLLEDPEYDIPLEEDDRVFIRQIPEWEVGPIIEILGEVKFPGTYSITKDSTKLSEIMSKAGGFTDDALIRETKLVRKSARITIDKEYERIKQMSREDMTESEYEYLVMKENTNDIGQIVVDFFKLIKNKDSSEDVILENEDKILIPKKPKVVYITGRVSKPGGVLFVPGKKIDYYIKKAGGATWDANKRKIKVTKVNGEIIDDEDVTFFFPGDIIWIPRKPERNWWQLFLQTMAVAGQIATIILLIDRTSK